LHTRSAREQAVEMWDVGDRIIDATKVDGNAVMKNA
jgi:hypothetical protein